MCSRDASLLERWTEIYLIILVCLVYYDKIHRSGRFMKNSNLSLLFLKAKKFKTRHLQSQCLAGLLLCFLVVSLAAEGDRPVIFEAAFVRWLDPIVQKAVLFMNISMWVKYQHFQNCLRIAIFKNLAVIFIRMDQNTSQLELITAVQGFEVHFRRSVVL